MNREILFRGKRTDNGEWIYGYPLIDTADCRLKIQGKCACPHDGSWAEMLYWLDDFHEYNAEEFIPSTLGQYTGLTDKNGVKIFEGDIVRRFNRNGQEIMSYSVEWCSDCCLFVLDCIDAGMEFDSDFTVFYGEELEIIGNIYDNPELLGGKSDDN